MSMKNHAGFVENTPERTLYMLGKNTFGQLGIGTLMDSFKKNQTIDGVVGFGTGLYHTTVLHECGDVFCAGNGFSTRFEPVPGLHNIVKIGVSFNRSYAIDEIGHLYEWSTKDDVHIVDTDRCVKDIAVGGKFYYLLDENGSLGMCGSNNYGQLLVRVAFLKNIVWIEDERAEMISAGSHHFVYVVSGQVKSLGSNTHGQLPRDVYGRVYDVSCGEYSTTIKTEWFHYYFGMTRLPYEISQDRDKVRAVPVGGGRIILPDTSVIDIFAEES
jgi:alpha-tubulin suppressor-like RCC1 family protein